MAKQRTSPIPTCAEWGNLDDLNVKYAFNLYGGKSLAEVTLIFACSPLERVDELRFAPWEIFSYYIFWFINFLTSDESKEEADSASCFLELVLEKARAEPEKFRNLYPRLKSAIDMIAGRQEFYGAPVEIYGSFLDCLRDIEADVV